MIGYWLLPTHILFNFLDFLMIYYFCQNMTRRKIEFLSLRPRTLTIKTFEIKMPTVGWGIVYGLVLGILLYHTSSYVFRTIVTISLISITKFLSKRSLSDSLIIYAFTFLTIMPVQILTWLAFNKLFSNSSVIDLITYLVATFFIVFLCNKVKLYKVFNYVKTNIFLKSALFILALIALIFLFFINFGNNPAYFIFYLIAISLVVMALIPLMARLYKRLETDVARAHYIANKILAARNAAYVTEDINEVRQILDGLVKHISPEAKEQLGVGDDPTESMMRLIEQKKKQRNINVEIIADIRYYENHKNVKIEQVQSFVALLLDNAFEVDTDKPIIIYISGANHSLDLSVSSEYLQTSEGELELIFEKGYSTKAEEGRGYGLYELKNEVEKLGGEIICCETYLEDYNGRSIGANYLVFTIQFRLVH